MSENKTQKMDKVSPIVPNIMDVLSTLLKGIIITCIIYYAILTNKLVEKIIGFGIIIGAIIFIATISIYVYIGFYTINKNYDEEIEFYKASNSISFSRNKENEKRINIIMYFMAIGCLSFIGFIFINNILHIRQSSNVINIVLIILFGFIVLPISSLIIYELMYCIVRIIFK